MKKTVITELTKKDMELLRNIDNIPENPCGGCYCRENGSCCGCQEEREYEVAIKPYKDAEILNLVYEIKDYKKNISEINRLKNKNEDLMSKFKDLDLDLNILD